jgi:hypothetical protein
MVDAVRHLSHPSTSIWLHRAIAQMIVIFFFWSTATLPKAKAVELFLCMRFGEDGHSIYHRNGGIYLHIQTVLQPRRPTLTFLFVFNICSLSTPVTRNKWNAYTRWRYIWMKNVTDK